MNHSVLIVGDSSIMRKMIRRVILMADLGFTILARRETTGPRTIALVTDDNPGSRALGPAHTMVRNVPTEALVRGRGRLGRETNVREPSQSSAWRSSFRAMSQDPAFPILLSLRIAAAALVLVAPVGIALAFVQARRRYPLRRLVDSIVLLPLVLPPSVVGFLLVVLFGHRGPLGRLLESALDLRVVFTPAAAVLASAVVSLPILVKTAQPAIEAVPTELEDVGRSLGLAPFAVFFRVTLPVAWRGVLAGTVLAFARAVGEFGATLMFAGNIPGRTNTMPLEIFAAYQAGDDRRAALYVGVLSALSIGVVLLAARLGPRSDLS